MSIHNKISVAKIEDTDAIMKFIDKEIIRYCNQHSNTDSKILEESGVFSIVLEMVTSNVTEIITKQETDKNKKLHEVLDRWESVLRDVLLNKIGCNDLCVYKNNKDDINKLTNKFKIIDLYNLLQEIRRARIVAKSNVNTHLILENILLT